MKDYDPLVAIIFNMITIAKNISKRLSTTIIASFSHKDSLINQTPATFAEQRVALHDNIWRTPDPSCKVKHY